MKLFFEHFSLTALTLLLATARRLPRRRPSSVARLEMKGGGNPATSFNSGQFGRITSQAGDPRIMQFGAKYDFYG